jgi:hypothetical protein
MTRERLVVVANGVLLVAIALVIAAVQLRDRGGAQIEGAVDRYATALAAQDLDGCLAELPPAEGDRWREFVQSQLGNRYGVIAVSVRSASIIERVLRHADPSPFEATLALSINRDDPESFFQAATRVPVTQADGRWYLAAPPLAPEAQG